MKRAVILVLDSFGLGATEDAEKFGDTGANTFFHIAEACARGECEQGRSGSLKLPNLARLGLAHAAKGAWGQWAPGFSQDTPVTGMYSYAAEISSGKDTPSGHWELAGVPVLFDWGYFDKPTDTFPPSLIQDLVEQTGIPGILANCHASGTEVLKEFGEQHMNSGMPICYTSADSVFQIAAHEETFGLDRLMEVCQVARKLVDPYNIGRVIARPFVGDSPETFVRTGNRRDLAVPPPAKTILNKLVDAGGEVVAIGKIADIYANQGISRSIKANGLQDLVSATKKVLSEPVNGKNQIVFTNLVDFDMLYGHRRDTNGYARALEEFDAMLPEVEALLGQEDILILTADHGCDPTWPGTDHTREHIPLLVSGPSVAAADCGYRASFADMGQSLAEFFSLPEMAHGNSLFNEPYSGA